MKDYVDLKKSAGRGHFTQEKFGTAYNRYKEAADLLESRTHVNRVAGFEEKNLKVLS